MQNVILNDSQNNKIGEVDQTYGGGNKDVLANKETRNHIISIPTNQHNQEGLIKQN